MDSLLRNLQWIEELLPQDIQMIPKHGGQAYFLDEHMVLILVERAERVYEHKGVTYPFDLWRGCIFPVEQKKQNAFVSKYLFLENHPVSKDWLYIPAESEHFEEEVKQVLREIKRRNPLLGIPLKPIKLSQNKASSTQPAKRKSPKKIKADKKHENNFILTMVKKESD
jgi:hypothetical protein